MVSIKYMHEVQLETGIRTKNLQGKTRYSEWQFKNGPHIVSCSLLSYRETGNSSLADFYTIDF